MIYKFRTYVKRPFPINAIYFDGTKDSAVIIEKLTEGKVYQPPNTEDPSGACFGMLTKHMIGSIIEEFIPPFSYIIAGEEGKFTHHKKDFFETIYQSSGPEDEEDINTEFVNDR